MLEIFLVTLLRIDNNAALACRLLDMVRIIVMPSPRIIYCHRWFDLDAVPFRTNDTGFISEYCTVMQPLACPFDILQCSLKQNAANTDITGGKTDCATKLENGSAIG